MARFPRKTKNILFIFPPPLELELEDDPQQNGDMMEESLKKERKKETWREPGKTRRPKLTVMSLNCQIHNYMFRRWPFLLTTVSATNCSHITDQYAYEMSGTHATLLYFLNNKRTLDSDYGTSDRHVSRLSKLHDSCRVLENNKRQIPTQTLTLPPARG